jgi:hypothetical protein
VRAFHTFTVWSFDAEAKRSQPKTARVEVDADADEEAEDEEEALIVAVSAAVTSFTIAARCMGSHAMAVIQRR